VISSTDFEKIMKVMLADNVDAIVKEYEKDTIIFPENVRNKIRNKIEKFVDTPKAKNFKISKFNERKNKKDIVFTITEAAETNTSVVDEAKKVHSDNLPLGTKLNYYKIKK
jgi:2-phospho-L-lactate guanylyltransferase (CobY/MobA/RfbA family)